MPTKLLLTFFATTLWLFCSHAQTFEIIKGDTVNLRDVNNLKQGKWMVFNKDGKFKGYEPDQLIEEGVYLNNKKTNVWTKYFPNGKKKHELTFANNVAVGFARFYHRSGSIKEEGVWKMNRWSGQYKYYYDNGNLKYDWSYNGTGKREGEQKYFHENGVLLYIGDWKKGNKEGELTEYYDDGSIKTKRHFDNGKVMPEKTKELIKGKEFDEIVKKHPGRPVTKKLGAGTIIDGYNKLMNKDGTTSKEGIFKDKRLINGKVYVYENGQVVKTINFENGKNIGAETVQ